MRTERIRSKRIMEGRWWNVTAETVMRSPAAGVGMPINILFLLKM